MEQDCVYRVRDTLKSAKMVTVRVALFVSILWFEFMYILQRPFNLRELNVFLVFLGPVKLVKQTETKIF